MVRDLGRSVAAELVKLRGLPSVWAAGTGTVVVAIALSAAVTADPAPLVPYLQIGPVLIGILAVATEYSGHQIRTTLTATPNRTALLIGKGVAALVATAATSGAALGAGLATAWSVRGAAPPPDGRPVAGAVLHLVLIGLLGFGSALLLRSLIAPLVTMLGLLFVVPPLLGGVAWLPDRAGRPLYLPDADPVLSPVTGGLVLLGWVAAVGVAAALAFHRRDA